MSNQNQKPVNKKSGKKRREATSAAANRKALLHQQPFESTVLHRFLDGKGGSLFGALERSAVLLRYTSDNLAINQDIENFLTFRVFDHAEAEVKTIEAQADEAEELLAMELPSVQYPDNQTMTIAITHPVYWKLISLMARADQVMSRIELLYLAAVITTPQHEQARHQLVSLFNRIQQKIFMVTSPGKRENRPYSVQQFLTALKADGGMDALMSRLAGSPAPSVETEESTDNDASDIPDPEPTEAVMDSHVNDDPQAA